MTTESTNTEHIEQRGAVIDTRLGAACPQGTVCRAFDRSVQLFGDRPAIVDGERAMSYRELGQRADTVARALRSAGVAPGDRVAMLMPNCLEFLPTLFGIWKAGAAFTQLPARGGPADFALILDMVKVRAVIYHERFDEPIAGIRPALNATDLFAWAARPAPPTHSTWMRSPLQQPAVNRWHRLRTMTWRWSA
jgi:acyl-CoA synthetase (AMP-forming)/AMP-acid ligase II